MSGMKQNMEGGNEKALSILERKRQEAFLSVINTLDERFLVDLKQSFKSHEQEYSITSLEDCIVAFAQQNRELTEELYREIVSQNEYHKEQAIAKLRELFVAYEKTVALFTELRSYHPTVASKLAERLPALKVVVEQAEKQWTELDKN